MHGNGLSGNLRSTHEHRRCSRHGLRDATLLVPALLACYLIWGSTYLAIRLALVSFPPFFQMGTRFLAAGVLLMAWLLWRGASRRGLRPLPDRRQWRNALVIGTLMLGGGMGLTASAEQHIGSGLIAAFIAVVPMLVCGWGLLFGQRPSRLELAGMVGGPGGRAAAGARRELLGLAAGHRLHRRRDAGLVAGLGALDHAGCRWPRARCGFASEMLCGGAVLMLVSLALGEQPAWPAAAAGASPRGSTWWCSARSIAFSAYLYLLAHASPAMATSYAFVNPVIALLLGVAFAGEAVTGGEWIACGVDPRRRFPDLQRENAPRTR